MASCTGMTPNTVIISPSDSKTTHHCPPWVSNNNRGTCTSASSSINCRGDTRSTALPVTSCAIEAQAKISDASPVALIKPFPPPRKASSMILGSTMVVAANTSPPINAVMTR